MNKLSTKLYLAFGTFVAVAGIAGAASADTLTDSITTVQTQLLTYTAPLAAAIVAVALAFVAVRLVPKAIRMISARFGG